MEFVTKSFDAIGCTNEVTVLDACAADAALEIARTHVAAIDVTCSRRRRPGLARGPRPAGPAHPARRAVLTVGGRPDEAEVGWAA